MNPTISPDAKEIADKVSPHLETLAISQRANVVGNRRLIGRIVVGAGYDTFVEYIPTLAAWSADEFLTLCGSVSLADVARWIVRHASFHKTKTHLSHSRYLSVTSEQ